MDLTSFPDIADGHSIVFTFRFITGSFLVDLLENEIVGFDENLTVAL